MATLYIAEFSYVGSLEGNPLASVAKAPPFVEQTVAIGVVASSNAFHPGVSVVRVHADAICSIKFGSAPTATTANMRLAANQTEYFQVSPGDKVSVITNV